jgi:hypothetical protein
MCNFHVIVGNGKLKWNSSGSSSSLRKFLNSFVALHRPNNRFSISSPTAIRDFLGIRFRSFIAETSVDIFECFIYGFWDHFIYKINEKTRNVTSVGDLSDMSRTIVCGLRFHYRHQLNQIHMWACPRFCFVARLRFNLKTFESCGHVKGFWEWNQKFPHVSNYIEINYPEISTYRVRY